jgi:hypothetical protein
MKRFTYKKEPIDMSGYSWEKLKSEHRRNAKKLGLKFGNFGWVGTKDSILSKTDKGYFGTTYVGPGKYKNDFETYESIRKNGSKLMKHKTRKKRIVRRKRRVVRRNRGLTPRQQKMLDFLKRVYPQYSELARDSATKKDASRLARLKLIKVRSFKRTGTSRGKRFSMMIMEARAMAPKGGQLSSPVLGLARNPVVRAYNIKYDRSESRGMRLPSELTFRVDEDFDIENDLANAVSDHTGVLVESLNSEIVKNGQRGLRRNPGERYRVGGGYQTFTLEEAKKEADKIFRKTGAIVSIVEYRPTPQVKPDYKYGIYTGRGIARNSRRAFPTPRFVGKGEFIWKKISRPQRMNFLIESFGNQITDRSKEILATRAWSFLPSKVKIVFSSKVANVELNDYR